MYNNFHICSLLRFFSPPFSSYLLFLFVYFHLAVLNFLFGNFNHQTQYFNPILLVFQEIHSALRLNLQSALHTALLLLPETFTEEEFYLTLAGLSYTGDFRMIVGEDKNKVANIVKPNIPRFRELYSKRVQSLSNHVELNPSRGRGEQDSSSSGRHHHLTQLPKNLQWFLVKVRPILSSRGNICEVARFLLNFYPYFN